MVINTSRATAYWFYLPAGVFVGLLMVLNPLLVLGLLGVIVTMALVVHVFKNPFFGVLCIAFFLPFERIGGFDVHGVTIRAHQLFALVTMISWVVRGLIGVNFKFRTSVLTWPMLLFWLSMIGSLINATNSIRGVMVYMFTVFTMSVGWMVVQLVDSRKKAIEVFKALAISAGLVSLFGIFQWVGDELGLPASITGIHWWYHKDVLGISRLQSTALEPLYFANYLMVVLPSVLCILLIRYKSLSQLVCKQIEREDSRAKLAQWSAIGLAIVMGVALILTTSRGGLAGMALAALVITMFCFRQLILHRFRIVIVGLGIFAVLALVLNAAGSPGKSIKFIFGQSSQVLETSADQERLESYQTTWSGIGLKPWFGQGPGQFGVYVSGITQGAPEVGWDIVNNEYLELLFETGLIGFMIMMLLIGTWFTGGYRAQRYLSDPVIRALLIGAMAGLAGILLQYMTFSTLYIMHIWFLIGYGAALQKLATDQKKTDGCRGIKR